MTSSAHLYMLPLAAVLLVLAMIGAMAWFRAVSSLAARLERLRDALRRGRRLPLTPQQRQERVPSRDFRNKPMTVMRPSTDRDKDVTRPRVGRALTQTGDGLAEQRLRNPGDRIQTF